MAKNMNKCFFCKRGDKCIRELCTFAHSWEELSPTPCKWDPDCKRRNCTYIHKYETKEEYTKRMFYPDIKRMGIFLPTVMDACEIGSIKFVEDYIKNHPKLSKMDIQLYYNSFSDEEEWDTTKSWGDLDEEWIQKDINMVRDLLYQIENEEEICNN
jgi:hypothetical protein